MRRSYVLLVGAVAAAGGLTLLDAKGGPGTASHIAGTALAAAPGTTAVAAPTRIPGPGEAIATARPMPGAPAGNVDGVDVNRPDSIRRAGDHYEAVLPDGRIARLTLDPLLQDLAEHLLDQSRAPRGAIVVMAPDGRILALAGRRTEDTAGGKTGTFDWHLATDAWAPAASVFKLVTASALVSKGVDPDGKVCFHGGLRSVSEQNLVNDKRDSRCESLAYGVAHSQNAILGKLAYQNLEPAVLDAEARMLGLTSPVVLGIPGMAGMAGEMTLPQQHDLAFAQAAAGFRGARLSVLGGALLASTFANAGEQPQPRLVASIDGQPLPIASPRRAIPADAARAVARMMVGTCANGTAAKTFGSGHVQVAGKTGTLTTTEPFYMEHSWFVGFAPADRPQIIVSVLLGNPQSWYLRGHEAARRLIDLALGPKQS